MPTMYRSINLGMRLITTMMAMSSVHSSICLPIEQVGDHSALWVAWTVMIMTLSSIQQQLNNIAMVNSMTVRRLPIQQLERQLMKSMTMAMVMSSVN